MYSDIRELQIELSKFALSSKPFEIILREEAMMKWNDKSKRYGKCNSTPFFWAYVEADGSVGPQRCGHGGSSVQTEQKQVSVG